MADSPRWVLKDQIAKLAAKGYELKTGVEPEFFILADSEVPKVSDAKDTQGKACYDAQALMRRYTLLKEIVNTLNACGFGVYQADHEDANGQFEINWHYSDCLKTADRFVFFKWVTKTLAERHGFRATFMPRPFATLTGNGLHAHCSLWAGGKNVFQGEEPVASSEFSEEARSFGLSRVALHFIGGVLEKAPAFCAITNPTVNSYKRLCGAPTASGATYAPNRISWSGNNRTHMVRVPDNKRFELRLADGAANPYLLPASILAAGLWGMDVRANPSRACFRADVNMYNLSDDAPEVAHIRSLPTNLLDALRALQKDQEFVHCLGAEAVDAFVKLKKAEWVDFMQHLSAWEVAHTLDC